MKDIQQLIKKNSQEGRYEDIFPKTFTDAVKDKESGKSKKSSWFKKLDPFAAFGRWLDRRTEREDKLWEEREAAEEKARKEKEESTEKGRAKLKKKTGKWTFRIMQDPIGTIKSALGFQGSDEEVLLETGVSEATIEAADASLGALGIEGSSKSQYGM